MIVTQRIKFIIIINRKFDKPTETTKIVEKIVLQAIFKDDGPPGIEFCA